MILALLQGAAQGAATEPAGPFVINGGVILWTLIIFGVLFFLLAKFGWPAVLREVELREERIRQQLEDASKANAEAQSLLAGYQAQLAASKEEAAAIVQAARQAAEKIREEIVGKGRAEQEELLERARREIAMEKERAVADLRREAVELSIAAASKVIERNLDSEADRKLVQDFLAAIPTPKGDA